MLDELEAELKIKVRPLSWPIGQGARFKGVYNIYEHQLNLFTPNKQRVTEKVEVDIQSSELDERVGEREAAQLREELELVDGVYPEFEEETYRSAEVAPVFFGSALNNFGVQELLDCFVQNLSSVVSSSRLQPILIQTTAPASLSVRYARASL